MFFRFGSAICVVVLISLVGIAIEKRSLELRRKISRQHYQMDVLRDQHSRLRLKSQELAGIERLFETVERAGSGLALPEKLPKAAKASSSAERPAVPLLFWRRPLDDPRLDERSRREGEAPDEPRTGAARSWFGGSLALPFHLPSRASQ
ncbi:MAG: hypothetical protein O2820_17535 [Planctomycetota bacterium]|nr:hypothetical protein [Planctomycetota bacterium]MDA1251022.1 hypothetical protein [Planctomycetota bacterium]